jgi:hypothetical protein
MSAQISGPGVRVARKAFRVGSSVSSIFSGACPQRRQRSFGNISLKRRSVPKRSTIVFIGICVVLDVHRRLSHASPGSRSFMRRGLTGAGLMAEHNRNLRRVPIEKSPTQLSPGGAKGARGLGNLGVSRDLEYASRMPH